MNGKDAALSTTDFDMQIGPDGDILTADFFDTSILYSLYGERRAQSSQVVQPQRRRGWIGNVGKDYENGSLLWLYSQERVTNTILRDIEDEARKALQWLVDDGYAVAIAEVTASLSNSVVFVEIGIERSLSIIDRRYYELWNNTGNVKNAA